MVTPRKEGAGWLGAYSAHAGHSTRCSQSEHVQSLTCVSVFGQVIMLVAGAG